MGILCPGENLRHEIKNHDALEDIEWINFSAQRAAKLVKDLQQAFQLEQDMILYDVDLNAAIKEAIQKVKLQWIYETGVKGRLIDVVTDLKPIPNIRGTLSDIHTILDNLLLNAVEAMPKSGKLTVSTALVKEGIQLTVRDSGTGMDEETLRRIFEPFFTTKMNVGSELGLSTVYGIITRWDGQISVESTPNEGSLFTLRFPISAAHL